MKQTPTCPQQNLILTTLRQTVLVRTARIDPVPLEHACRARTAYTEIACAPRPRHQISRQGTGLCSGDVCPPRRHLCGRTAPPGTQSNGAHLHG